MNLQKRINFQVKFGGRRIVFLIGQRAYKIPNFRRWVSFIRGIEENLEERYWWSADGSRKREPNRPWDHEHLAEIFWADRFGFLLIMERLDTSFMVGDEVDFEMVTQLGEDISVLRKWAKGFSFYPDIEPRNVGYRDGKLLLLDYGYFGGTMDCYIGT